MSPAAGPGGARRAVAYLDHAATSPVRPEVAEAMAPFAARRFGNASGPHRVARDARLALEDAREEIAGLLGAAPAEVILTSGGTESDNLALLGSLAARLERGLPTGSVVCSAVEHPAVREAARAAGRGLGRVLGIPPLEVREAPVDRAGRVDPGALGELLDPGVAVVSVMLANNEVGTVQPLDEVAAVVRARAPEAVLHTDAVQAAPWVDVAGCTAVADLVSVSAHKLGGPKGVGALVARRGVPLRAILHGGGQEQERRSGTQDVAGAVGLARALRSVAAGGKAEADRVAELRNALAAALHSAVPGIVESVPRPLALPGHCHLRIPGVEQEELLVVLDELGVCASAGAACASGAVEPSHVLRAMGVAPEESRSAVRFSLGYSTTAGEVSGAITAVVGAVARLRA